MGVQGVKNIDQRGFNLNLKEIKQKAMYAYKDVRHRAPINEQKPTSLTTMLPIPDSHTTHYTYSISSLGQPLHTHPLRSKPHDQIRHRSHHHAHDSDPAEALA